jgi:transglutaminase-like putative cysteine protease
LTNKFTQREESGNDSIHFSYYHISADNLNLDVVSSYPQKIIKYISGKSPYEIVIRTFSENQDQERVQLIKSKLFSRMYKSSRHYKEVKEYLEPTPLIESGSLLIKDIADTLINYDSSFVSNLDKILKWVSVYVKYDNNLANQISDGEINTQSALKTLECKKGTCSEYTNLFIAIMRSLGIPSRFIVGVISEKGHTMYHAWAECYIEGVGWHEVDPQTAQVWKPAMGIKLFSGKDFIDCNIKVLPDIKAIIRKIDDN